MSGFTSRGRKRAVAAIPVLALAATGLVSFGASTAVAAESPVSPPVISDSEYYMNYVAPRAEDAFGTDQEVVIGNGAGQRSVEGVIAEAEAIDEKFSQGNPIAAQGLAQLEAASIETGKSPGELKREWNWEKGKHQNKNKKPDYKQADETQEAKLLTILVEFSPTANDDFSGVQVPTEFGATECKPGSVQNGPLHNNIPNPADYELEDNNSMWVADFSPEHFNKMLFTDKGITERVRKDLRGPDGKRGIDISGYTMKAMYEEMSQGAYTVTGEATPWVTVPHSEGYYGASRCFLDEGVYKAGAIQDMQGHPDNPLGAGQLPIDAVDGAGRAPARLPVGRLRHRGPGRPRRRRRLPRARRRHRPRRARARRRRQVGRRRRRGHLRPLGALLGRCGRRRHPRHRPQAVELHRPA